MEPFPRMSSSSLETVASPVLSPLAVPHLDPRHLGPIRAELLGLERLEALARSLAQVSDLRRKRSRTSPLLRRFEENGRILSATHKRILSLEKIGDSRSTDAEWLADNYHIVEEVLREVRQDLPAGYDSELPKLGVAPLVGYPRVYALALAVAAHTDCELDETRITRFVESFQEVAPLTIGEIWALPTMFRLVLLENLRRLAEQMTWGWDERERADRFVAEGLDLAASTTSTRFPNPELTDPFVVRVVRLLRDQGQSSSAAIGRFEGDLLANAMDANETLRREYHRQAANQVSVGNCVIGLRLLAALDWNVFFERVSRVEAILRQDPSGVYALQDFPTRDRQRRELETIARRSSTGEEEVARRAVELAALAQAQGERPSRSHVGYYLVDRGADRLRTEFGFRPRWKERALRWGLDHPRAVYFGSILTILGVILFSVAASFGRFDLMVVAALLALFLPMSEIAVGLVNHLLTLFIPPRVLPKREMKDGIPADCATIVVMPSMLVRASSIEVLLERLEIHYLANPDTNLTFALLTDFADADEEHRPEDGPILRDALERVHALNQRLASPESPRFFLFHRRRLWNPIQGKWMGWERKRGKLSEFNRLVRGAQDTSYATLSHDPALLSDVRYVITLDADTQMPRDTARRLVGTIAHPLNEPRFDPEVGRVVEGHAVLQPRVSFHLTAATHSRFAAILASSGGIDPYSAAASDTYMDLFGVGSFTGKGIYELDSFEAATGHTFPDNQILSHDLIEGNFARCGLISDTELFDDFPARYHAFARREHRWVRGDWQLLPWLGRVFPSPTGPRRNPLPTLERWKLLDNLRRSLVPPALVLMLILGWTVLPGSPWAWTCAGMALMVLPLIQLVLATVLGAARSRKLSGFLSWRDRVPATIAQVAMSTSFLADQARNLCDATARTLFRLFVSHRNMLEWETAASTERRLGTGLLSFFVSMWPAPALALAITALIATVNPAALNAALPLLAAWGLSPLIAWWVSRPRGQKAQVLTPAEQAELRKLARKTWLFFETFVGETDNWLPPDNHQEFPDGRVAHRTSPTNQGLLLLSTLSAYDFGYIGPRTVAERLEKTFATFDRMERHWGHFYNWYDTRTLQPLPPAYISTVDSGNLMGSLITLRRGLMELINGPVLGPDPGRGLGDSLALVAESFDSMPIPTSAEALSIHRGVALDLGHLAQILTEEPAGFVATEDWLARLDWSTLAILGKIRSLEAAGGSPPEPMELWSRRLASEIAQRRAELAAIVPHLAALRDHQDPSESWAAVREAVDRAPSLAILARNLEQHRAELEALSAKAPGFLSPGEAEGGSVASDLIGRLERLSDRAGNYAAAMDFSPLYKAERNLYTIGCNLALGRLDNSCYDLLASESCLTSFLAVARGDAPRRHWFMLGRPFIRSVGRVGLISWGGTMFEYLMPRLMLKAMPDTLVSDAARTAVARQIEYGAQKGVPWGISESAYNAQYLEGDYQYQSFGVPGLGLKRGLEKDTVIAPYATALATMIAPREAIVNLRRIAAEGGVGPYGLYEAIDFTPERVPKGATSVVIRQYMAHHQGMSLVALGNALLDEPMPRRFHSEPMVRAAELLLQERIPRDAPMVEPSEFVESSTEGRAAGIPLMNRRLTTASTPAPRTHVLSNTNFHVMLTNAGSGRSRFRDREITRWNEDPTCDNWGQFLYLRDSSAETVWSAGFQPMCRTPEFYEVVFSTDKATFRRRDGQIETFLEVAVSPEAPLEVRRVTVTNHDSRPRDVEVTSYAEVVLLPLNADASHPAFGKLFIETEWLPGPSALLSRRRPRASEQPSVWAVHVVASDESARGEVQFETDRARFLGRGRSTADPAALDPGAVLSGTTGPVLDPIVSLRRVVKLDPGTSSTLCFTTAFAETREQAADLADQYSNLLAPARAFEVAWAHSQVEHRQRNLSADTSHLFQRLASHLIYAGSALRADASVIAANRQPLSSLWRHGISGDWPIVLVRIGDAEELALAHQLVEAHAYLRLRGVLFDLVLWNEEHSTYLNELHQSLMDLIRGNDLVDQPTGIFIRKATHARDEDRTLLQAVARVVLIGDRGPLGEQLDRIERMAPLPPALLGSGETRRASGAARLAVPDLDFFNGLGGFARDDQDYVIVVKSPAPVDVRRNGKSYHPAPPRPALPPAPWINVIANPSFGFLISEWGAGNTWAENSQANRLTAWNNDPVSDPPGEVVYLRDESTGEIWCPTPGPILSDTETLVRHRPGSTTFEKNTHGLVHQLTLFVPPDDPVKIVILKVTNTGSSPRRLSATYYAEWVLGTTSAANAMHIVTEEDPETGALLALNPSSQEFGERVAFLDVDRRPRSLTGDRTEFLGRNGSRSSPVALKRVALSGRTGVAMDPCGAVQVPLTLAAGETAEVVFLLGQGESREHVRRLVLKYRVPDEAAKTLVAVQRSWRNRLETIQVRTPDPAMDLLMNRWLLTQVLSCRVWARSALYQSGGAYGFRDQLQDVAALVWSEPDEARAHILRAASRQFEEGDVQHWWHPPSGRGVRTKISDDMLWLPFVTCHYIEVTGDTSILDQTVPYLKAPLLKIGQDDDYGQPSISEKEETLYMHCLRSIQKVLISDRHGLPLMGAGDWNDGMNHVGSGGQGESVWLGWFLASVLDQFSLVAGHRGDPERGGSMREQSQALRGAIEESSWDGHWYRRAYFDDGTPLGSASNDECQIDSLPQTWSVLAQGLRRDRSEEAMQNVWDRLVEADARLVLLFDPPFDQGDLRPGYIRGYLPGIRENGGQYTHAATWVALAFAELGQGDRAHQVFDLLNPISRTSTEHGVARYRVEPYVLAGDVYSRDPHKGRGGWSWYTGSASWLYRVGLEAILGFKKTANRLTINPCLPGSWKGFELDYRFGTTMYRIRVDNPEGVERGVVSLVLDGTAQQGREFALADDGGDHRVEVRMGLAASP